MDTDEIKDQNDGGDTSESGASAGGVETTSQKCERERGEYLEGWQRAKADFQNYKREEKERFIKAVNFAAEDVIGNMIHVLDSFNLGLQSLEKAGPVDRGIYMIKAQLEDALKKSGLEKIPIEIGAMCDHNVAEPIAQVPSDLPEGAIVEEIEPGYRLHAKVLRPARVTISAGKNKGEE